MYIIYISVFSDSVYMEVRGQNADIIFTPILKNMST